jgi:hypothetical protein
MALFSVGIWFLFHKFILYRWTVQIFYTATSQTSGTLCASRWTEEKWHFALPHKPTARSQSKSKSHGTNRQLKMDEQIDLILAVTTFEPKHFWSICSDAKIPVTDNDEISALLTAMTEYNLIKNAGMGQHTVKLSTFGNDVKTKYGNWTAYQAQAGKVNPTTINLHIGDKGNVQKNYGTIGESMNQVSESAFSSEKNEIKKQTRQPTEKPNRKISKYEKWTLILGGLSILVTIILKLLDYIAFSWDNRPTFGKNLSLQ